MAGGRALAGALLILALLPSTAAAEKLKAFKLKTLEGVEQTLDDVRGTSKATLVVFFFPTCPYCNAAFPSVQKLYDTLKPAGLSMVWINVVPDEEKLIAPWRAKHGYTVPVLLGTDRVVRDYNLRTTPTHFLVDARGEIVSRQNGFNAGDEQKLEREIRKALGGPAVARSTPHLDFTATLSSDVVAADGRLTLQVDVTPKKGIHVYAPGTQYRAIAVQIDAPVTASPAVYPKAERYLFKPLKEEVLVYSDPFRLSMDVAVGALPARESKMKIAGVLTYQACDDRICYLPESIPLEWTLRVVR